MPHIIRTERLLLRPPALRDAQALAAAINDPAVTAPSKLWPYPVTREVAAFMLRQCRAMRPAVDHVFLVMEGRTIHGTVGLHHRRDDRFGAGYMLGRAAWGRGLATEAVRAVCAFGFNACRAGTIAADVFKDNPGSIRVLEKVGMRLIGDIGPGWSTTLQTNRPRWGYEMTRTEFKT